MDFGEVTYTLGRALVLPIQFSEAVFDHCDGYVSVPELSALAATSSGQT